MLVWSSNGADELSLSLRPCSGFHKTAAVSHGVVVSPGIGHSRSSSHVLACLRVFLPGRSPPVNVVIVWYVFLLILGALYLACEGVALCRVSSGHV